MNVRTAVLLGIGSLHLVNGLTAQHTFDKLASSLDRVPDQTVAVINFWAAGLCGLVAAAWSYVDYNKRVPLSGVPAQPVQKQAP